MAVEGNHKKQKESNKVELNWNRRRALKWSRSSGLWEVCLWGPGQAVGQDAAQNWREYEVFVRNTGKVP